jgi:predicted anti-sigma-YlaC factor YlaD
MNCNLIREQLVDVAAGAAAPAVVQNHLHSCAACELALDEMRQTMALLDEWQAPEPSPYFDVKLQARLREEKQKATASWLDWFRKPVLGVLGALLIAAGVGLFEYDQPSRGGSGSSQGPVVISRGTPVGDVEFLDKNSDLLQNFDALDALDGTVDSSPETN